MGKLIAGGVALAAGVAFAARAGAEFGDSAAWLFRVLALAVLGLCIFAGLWLWHRRKSHELIVARYHLKGDALGWPRHIIQFGQVNRTCPDCGIDVHSYATEVTHDEHHKTLWELADRVAALEAELARRGGGVVRAEDPDPVPWSAVVEDSAGGAVEVSGAPGADTMLDTAEGEPGDGELDDDERAELDDREQAELESLESRGARFRARMDRINAR